MYGRAGLERFKKAQSLEPFSIAAVNPATSASKPTSNSETKPPTSDNITSAAQKSEEAGPPATQLGGGQSSWLPPDWSIEPRPGVHYLEVLKDGEVLDRINLDRRRHVFGRQFAACDFVLDHQSVSRQHAAVVLHKNGSVFVIDLGSAHGTFVANERLSKDIPVELEAGQSLRFAASTRTYVLRKNNAALFARPPPPAEVDLPPIPDPSDEAAVVAYNTLMNRYGISRPVVPPEPQDSGGGGGGSLRAAKRLKKGRVAFRDEAGGELAEVVGFSDGADVGTEPGPIGVKEGALVGKYESLVQVTVIPKGKEQSVSREDGASPKGVTGKLQEVLDKVKRGPKSGIYDDLYGESFVGKVGSSWAYSNKDTERSSPGVEPSNKPSQVDGDGDDDDDDDDDLFGD